jgi:sensor histidine kinase regulating citrate/malate metabolism
MVLLVCLLVLSLTLVAGGMYTVMIGDALKEQIGKRALQVSKTVAQIPLVREQITKPQPDGTLQKLAEKIRLGTGAKFIVIGNRDSIRFSHPKPERLGKQMVGGDNAPALERGESYISQAVGTLGASIRGKVPIFDNNNKVIGIVSVGYLLDNVQGVVRTHQHRVGLLVGILMLLGILGALSISRSFKKQFLVLNRNKLPACLLNVPQLLSQFVRGSLQLIVMQKLPLLTGLPLKVWAINMKLRSLESTSARFFLEQN